MSRPRIGLDIGGTKIHAVALGTDLSVLAEHRVPTGWGEAAVVRNAVDATLATLARADLTPRDVELVGVGIPGAVDHRSGCVEHALNLGLDHLDLAGALGSALGAPVHVENDVNAAALGVALSESRGGGGAAASLGYLNLGTGLAAGFVVDGQLWRGARGAAGEIGHVPLPVPCESPDGVPPHSPDVPPPCHCGLVGCLETMASGSGIQAQWRAARGAAPLDIKHLPALAAHDAVAARILHRLHVAVAAAVRLLVLTVDVERVVIGGGVARLGTELLTRALAVLREWEASSPFLAAVEPSSRVTLLRSPGPVAAVGAALGGALPA